MTTAGGRGKEATSPLRRGRRPGPDSSRASVLEAALQLFAEVGFERATIRAIAAHAGVNPALVHRFFGMKDDLLRATLVLPIDPDAVFAGLEEHPGDEGRTQVARVLELWRQPQVREQFTALLRSAVSHELA